MSFRRMLVWLFVCGPWWPLLLILVLRGHEMPSWTAWYWRTDPKISAAWFALVYAIALYIGSVLTGKCSIFDFNWSMLPASGYVLHFAFHPLAHPDETRRILVIAAVWFWSVRLTGNWLLKGGLGFEDFRYIRFKETMNPVLFQLWSFTALFLVQSAIVLTMMAPTALALAAPGRPIGFLDGAACLVVAFGVIYEAIADWQTHCFRQARAARNGAPPRFLTTGLFRYSRHPNYFGEICVWWGIYLFSIAATGKWLNWSIAGPITINGLFVLGSVQLTENHELRRKPEYADYQRTTSRLIPWFPFSDGN